MERDKIYLGDNLEILKDMPDNSVDSIVTDPPYGLGKEPNVVEVMKDWIEKGYHDIKGKGFMGKEWDAFVPQPNLWKECLRVLKPGGHLLSFAGTRTYDWVVMGLRFAGFEIRDQIAWVYGSGFPKSYDVSKGIDKNEGVEHPKNTPISSNNSMSGANYTRNKMKVKSDLTKLYEGWGTALKPALEPIVMARKPLKGTVAENVIKYGTGGINIDECRVATDDDIKSTTMPNLNQKNGEQGIYNGTKINAERLDYKQNDNGRFPANLIHDGSDEVVELFPNEDDTSASRFFYCAKASKSERNMGLGGFKKKYTASAEFRPNHMEKAKNGDNGNPFGRWQPTRNIHPTVKPIDLMRYLVRLVTPKDGIVLDPYMGSGTTAIACKKEKMHYIGCELSEEYLEIAKARIKSAIVEYDIFDYL
jgi:site-specific DNA-methyltransferase (adenine-specific)